MPPLEDVLSGRRQVDSVRCAERDGDLGLHLVGHPGEASPRNTSGDGGNTS